MKLFFATSVCLITLSSVEVVSSQELAAILADSEKVRQAETKPIQAEMNAEMKAFMIDVQDQLQLINGLKVAEQQPSVIRTEEIDRLQRRLAILHKLDAYVASSDEEQKQQLAKADGRLQKLQARQREAMKPAQEKIRQLSRKYADRHQQLGDAMKPYLREASDEPVKGLKRSRINAQFHECAVTAVYTAEKKPTMQISIIYLHKPQLRGTPIEKLSDAATLYRSTGKFATALAGRFQVKAVVVGKETWAKDRIKQTLVALVDLDALSKLKIN